MTPAEEMSEFERLWRDAPHSAKFHQLQRSSKWGERIREELVQKIRSREPAAIEDGIVFLEVNPWYFRSGYNKNRVASALKSARLTSAQAERLRNVILAATTSSRVGPEFSEYARLAIVVANVDFLAKVEDGLAVAQGWRLSRMMRLARLCEKHSFLNEE